MSSHQLCPDLSQFVTQCPKFRRADAMWCISVYCKVRHFHEVELVALRRVAPRRAAQRPAGAAHSVRSTRTGLSQRDKHHLQETEAPCRVRWQSEAATALWLGDPESK